MIRKDDKNRRTLHAVFDGEVLRPDQPVPLEHGTRVRITIEAEEKPKAARGVFLKTARSLNLDGPEDWSARLEHYLYGDAEPRD